MSDNEHRLEKVNLLQQKYQVHHRTRWPLWLPPFRLLIIYSLSWMVLIAIRI